MFYKIKNFIKNIWLFRKELVEYKWFDYSYNVMMFRKTIEITEKNIREKGIEVPESRLKKCDKMKRLIYLLKCFEDDNYLELAEKELGVKYIIKHIDLDDNEIIVPDDIKNNNKRVSDKSIEIKRKHFKEIFEILRGQDYQFFDKNKDFHEQFDGTGIETWWD